MKIILKIYAFIATALIVTSCINDTGNYDYISKDELLPISILGITDTVNAVRLTSLTINPNIENMDDESRYSYSWYVTPTSTQASLPTRTLLSESRNLDIKVELEGGYYFLSFEIRDKNKDIYTRHQSILNVQASEINTGWYILKDIDDETDFDYINTEGTLYPDVLLRLAIPTNSRLKGKAVSMAFQKSRYTHQTTDIDGSVITLKNQQALYILSSEDIKTFNAKDISIFKGFNDMFYSKPNVCKPQSVIVTPSNPDVYLINNGKGYAISGLAINISIFGAPKTGFYSLHNDMLPGASTQGMVFDNESSSFLSLSTSGLDLSDYAKPAVTDSVKIALTNMDVTLLNLVTAYVPSVTGVSTGFAIMKNKSNGEKYLANISLSGTKYPFTAIDTIPTSYKMPDAKVKAAPQVGNCIFFGEANKLWVYLNAKALVGTQREVLLKELPASEAIAYIKNIPTKTANYLAVLTNSANGWKLYLFRLKGQGTTGEIESEPAHTYQGKGTGRFVMYR